MTVASAILATLSIATPNINADAWRPGFWRGGRRRSEIETKCMSDADASTTADIFRQLIQGYTKEMALAALTEDFTDYSSADLVEPIFTSRAEFMEGHGKQQPIPFETLAVWHNCDGIVSMRWKTVRSGQGQKTEAAAIPVVGTAILATVPAEAGNTYNYRIKTLYSEFNTAAWLVNNGVFKPAANVTVQMPPPDKRGMLDDAWSARKVEHWSDVGLI
ncbi:hypothetical protein Tdes44962_MAKER01165 [Teratosphaeria destructans]|uniref:NTF2-like domain-containing protein n=1 Tax=Teratosphaeria destructans TaxID=418781 RepID=A0A9W7W748_9PEZI|nr:hypothetical protein Tdes44962_MAKER01165 [Teratosphaeria destructans]